MKVPDGMILVRQMFDWRNSFGVEPRGWLQPEVARASQPRAGGRNPLRG